MNDAQSRGGRAGLTKQSKTTAGFTIVETMIVLAVTGFLLIIAMYLIVGQQNKVQFTQSIQEIQSSIQQTMNEVGTGFYPNSGNLRCTGGSGTLTFTAGSAPQGSNTGCIFLGKAIQFGVRDTDPQEYIVHSIAGLQENGGSLQNARPTAIARGESTNTAGLFDSISSSVTGRLLYGLQAIKMEYVQGNVRRPIGAVAFVSGLGTYQNGDLLSGTQQLMLVPVGESSTNAPNSPLSTESEKVVDAINRNLDDPLRSPVNPTGGVEICFISGGTNQSGLITIGSNGRSLSVKLAIKSTKDCT